MALKGILGPLQWRDLQAGGTGLSPGRKPHDPAGFTLPADRE